MVREPKYGHLKELHRAIKLCEHALVSSDPTVTSLGTYQQVCISNKFIFCCKLYGFHHSWCKKYSFMLTVLCDDHFQARVFSSGKSCAAFLANFHPKSAARVVFNNMHYDLPSWSISILPDCRNVVFNTARVYASDYPFQNRNPFAQNVYN